MTDYFFFFVVSSFFVYYASSALLLEEKESHFGPFPSKTVKVKWVIFTNGQPSIQEYQATLFDKIRYLFGLYTVEIDTVECDDADPASFDMCKNGRLRVWVVRPEREEVWTCPVCLSGWLALIPVVVSFALFTNVPLAVVLWFAIAGGSSFLHNLAGSSDFSYVIKDDGEANDVGTSV